MEVWKSHTAEIYKTRLNSGLRNFFLQRLLHVNVHTCPAWTTKKKYKIVSLAKNLSPQLFIDDIWFIYVHNIFHQYVV